VLSSTTLFYCQSIRLLVHSDFLSGAAGRGIGVGHIAQRRALPAGNLLRAVSNFARRQQHGHEFPARSSAASGEPPDHRFAADLWTASGVMISWMEGFRRCYELPKIWGLVKERLISFLLVILRAGADDLLHAAGGLRQQDRNHHSLLHRTRIQRLHPADVDVHSLAHRHAYQHRGDRAHLSQRGPAHPALA
jgi:hypothetical protein